MVGDRWLAQRESLVLRVPSVLVSGEFNYLINPAHPSFVGIKVGTTDSVVLSRARK
jgi:RES domain-containing protein